MTKKTNVLVFRFGINVLWKNKSLNKASHLYIVQLENTIYKILNQKQLKTLYIYYTNNKINIISYNYVYQNKGLHYEIITYIQRVLYLKKTADKFNISNVFIKWFLQNKNYNPLKLIRKSKFKHIANNYLVIKVMFKYLIHNIIKQLYLYGYLIFNIITTIYKLLSLILVKYDLYRLRNLSNINTYLIQIRKSNGLLYFKYLEVYLEIILYKFYRLFIVIYINNIFVYKGLFLKYKAYKKYNQKLLFIYQAILISILYNNSKLLTDYISYTISIDKNHKKILKLFINNVEQIYFYNVIKLVGFQLRLNGKLAGKMRKSKYHYKLGQVKQQTLALKFNFNLGISYTKFGIISVKVWLINEYNKL